MDKIQVCNSINELKEFLKKYNNKTICLYLAEKTKDAWDKSTSRVYMNRISGDFIYLPVNIKKGDWESIKEVYQIADRNNQIVAINQTQPHKSNPVQREWFYGQDIPKNVDSLVKDASGKLKCFDLNGPSFVGWFEDEVGSFSGKTVIIFGVGGVGEPIARMVANKNPKRIYLIDIASKEPLVKELSEKIDTVYYDSLKKINYETEQEVILINCAGKEGGDDKTINTILEQLKDRNNIFVDLRPQLHIEIVEKAKHCGWDAYSGYGMNARNDYALLQKIQEIANINIPSFKEFAELVKKAS